MSKAVSNNLVGMAGEYYVCAELCRLGFVALMTPKNNPLFDIVATNAKGSRSIAIQVKTRSMENKQGWKFGKDMETPSHDPNRFVILVNLDQTEAPQYYVYEQDSLAETVRRNYRNYSSQLKKDGAPRKDVDFRWHDERNFTDDDQARKNNWSPIGRLLAGRYSG